MVAFSVFQYEQITLSTDGYKLRIKVGSRYKLFYNKLLKIIDGMVRVICSRTGLIFGSTHNLLCINTLV